MKNNLLDLNNHLFAQIERLSDENISDADLAKEVTRSAAMSQIASQVISNANLVLRARTEFSAKEIKDQMPVLFCPSVNSEKFPQKEGKP